MNGLIIVLTCAALLVAGLIGITLSVPLQAPAVVLLGLAAIFAAIQVMKCRSAGVRESGSFVEGQWLLGLSVVSIGYFVVRACLSPVLDLGVEDLMLILPAGLLYLIAGHGVAGKSGARFRQGLAWIVVILLLMHLGSCLLQLGGGDGYSLSMFLNSASRASDKVVTGMYSYRGSFANFAVIGGILCLSLGVWGRSGWMIRGLIFILGLMALAFAVLSQSRSAVVSMVLALAVFGAMTYMSVAKQRDAVRVKVRFTVVAMVGLLLILGFLGGVKVFQDRANNASGVNVAFDSGVRLAFWPMAVEQWQDHPVVGAGSRSYSYECFKYWSPNLSTSENNPEFVHNEYLQLLADYGLIGLLCILILIVGHLMMGVKRINSLSVRVGENGMRGGSNVMALTIAGVCGMTAMSVHVIFDFRTHLLANLLLLVCCAVWILPVTKSTVWKSGSRGVGKSRMGSWVLGIVILVLGLGAIGIGGQQLWGGWALIENRMAKEDGAWDPSAVDRAKWIPLLETSVERVPSFRRYLKLGTLYTLEAREKKGEEVGGSLDLAILNFRQTAERHPYDPVSHINIAKIETDRGNYASADVVFKNISPVAVSRERWFRMHSVWAKMHQRWAVDLWNKKDIRGAENHFLRAKELFKESYDYAYFYQNKQWVVEYSRLLITYARCLDGQKKYAEAELLFQEGREQVNWYNWQVDTKLNFYYGKHFYERGKYVWYQRKPEQAYQMMKKARAQLRQHKAMMKSDVEEGYDEQLAKIQKVIDFLEQTGIK
jgi:O-antigen ligase/tetratricopeptide (TPR) repeat protein